MEKKLIGKAFTVGKNIDTDLIYPGCYLELTDPNEIGSHCFAGIDANISSSFPQGGIVVADANFGCGSSREHAAIALIHMGASAVIGESFARIFYRNGINLGLPLLVCRGIREKVKMGYTLEANLQTGEILIKETGEQLRAEPMGSKVMEILSAGGIKPLMLKKHKKAEGEESNGY